MLYLPISKSWMVSRLAQRIYLISALAVFCFVGVEIAAVAAMLSAGALSFEDSPLAALIVRFLLWPGILGSALIWVSMWYFWFSFDKSPWHKKAIWFVLLWLIAPLSHAFYYFLVYRKTVELERSNP